MVSTCYQCMCIDVLCRSAKLSHEAIQLKGNLFAAIKALQQIPTTSNRYLAELRDLAIAVGEVELNKLKLQAATVCLSTICPCMHSPHMRCLHVVPTCSLCMQSLHTCTTCRVHHTVLTCNHCMQLLNAGLAYCPQMQSSHAFPTCSPCMQCPYAVLACSVHAVPAHNLSNNSFAEQCISH
jgi:hypothetical protein